MTRPNVMHFEGAWFARPCRFGRWSASRDTQRVENLTENMVKSQYRSLVKMMYLACIHLACHANNTGGPSWIV